MAVQDGPRGLMAKRRPQTNRRSGDPSGASVSRSKRAGKKPRPDATKGANGHYPLSSIALTCRRPTCLLSNSTARC
jgi:hypothetical protein